MPRQVRGWREGAESRVWGRGPVGILGCIMGNISHMVVLLLPDWMHNSVISSSMGLLDAKVVV